VEQEAQLSAAIILLQLVHYWMLSMAMGATCILKFINFWNLKDLPVDRSDASA
jgi:hypothetical protein